MTLDEAMKAKKLFILEPFAGFKPCGKLTGRYYYATVLTGDKEKDSDLYVEVKSSFFTKKFVQFSFLREVKEIKCS